MSVYKRPGQTVYSYDFRCRGARFSGTTNCTTKREAERYEQEMRAQAKAATVDRSRPMTFAVASSLYWDEKGQFLANSLDLERYLAWLQKHVGKATLVSAISDSDIASLVARRRGELAVRGKGERVSNATVNRSVTQPMRAILRRCAKTWKQAVQDIEWKDHFLKEPQERVREATPDEEARLLAAIRPDYRPVVRFAILTGCRMSEILTLEWARVNFFNDTFTVIGKGDRQRSIPMVKEVRDLLWDLKDHHPEMVFTFQATKTRDGHLRGKRYPITENGFKTQWRRSNATPASATSASMTPATRRRQGWCARPAILRWRRSCSATRSWRQRPAIPTLPTPICGPGSRRSLRVCQAIATRTQSRMTGH